MTDHIWTRRDGESSVAYQAFREYLNQGHMRSNGNVAETLGKSTTLMNRWSSAHDWVARSVAYDSYIAEAGTDGLVNAIAETRDKNLALMDKLRGLLDTCLDDHIARREPPSIRWTQATMAMAKIEANSLMMKDDKRTDARIDRIEELVERAMEERAPA